MEAVRVSKSVESIQQDVMKTEAVVASEALVNIP
jgi:hypothetical protein